MVAAWALHAWPAHAQVATPPRVAPEPAATMYGKLDFPRLKSTITLTEAVRRALSANANVVVQEMQVRAEEGNVQQARGAYDTEGIVGGARESGSKPLKRADAADFATAGLPERRADFVNSTNYNAGITRLLESGAQLDAGLTVSTSTSTLAALSGPQQTTANLRFGIRVPLLRNAGGIQQSTTLKARELERDASIEDLVHASATAVLAVVQAYWELAGRIERIEILKASEARAQALVAEITKLVAADQIPGAELDLAQASEAEKRAARVAEEQSFQTAWNALGRLLRAETNEVTNAGLAIEKLPAIDKRAVQLTDAAISRKATAIERRGDVRAAHLRERSAYFQLIAAQDGLKPQVDLIAALTTHGLAEGTSSPTLDLTRPFPSINVGVEMRFPFRNNVAQGTLLSRVAAHDQSVVRLHDLESSVGPVIVTAASALRRIVLRYQDTVAATSRYEIAVKNEYVKRRLGLATLIDVINVQDRLDSAHLLLLQLRQEYAVAIAQLLFENGELVTRDAEGYQVDIPTLGGAGFAKAAR